MSVLAEMRITRVVGSRAVVPGGRGGPIMQEGKRKEGDI